MAADKKTDKNVKTKKPSALKRNIQSENRRQHNKQFKSTVKTAVRSLESAVATKQADLTKEKLSDVFSLMDKAAKTGVFKKNKANRLKSKFAKKALA